MVFLPLSLSCITTNVATNIKLKLNNMSITVEKLKRSAWVSSQMASLLEMKLGESKEIKPKDINSYSALKMRISRNKTGFIFRIEEQNKVLKITRTN